MTPEKREIIILGVVGIVFALLICGLGIWIYSLETAEETNTYFFLGITLTGKVLAAIVTWLGLIILFFSIRKMAKRLP